MSSPLQVRIARSGKELGTYDSAEALRLLGVGTLKPTDHYWHLGMGGWELLSNLGISEGLRLKSEAKKKLDREKAERESRAREDERLRQRVEAEVRARLAQESGRVAPIKGAEENNLGCYGGVLFVGGVIGVIGTYISRNKAQSASDGLTFLSGSRRYTSIDSSGYDAFAFVAGAVALLGLGLIIAGLARKK